MAKLQPGDSLVAARLDRLGRTMLDVMGLVGSLVERQVRVRLLDVGIETGTANGQLFLTILAGFAEFEREIIRERTRAGLEVARRNGSRLGRPARLTERQRRHAVELHKAGKSLHEIAKIMGVSKTTDCEPVITTDQDTVEPPESQSGQGFCKVGLPLTYNSVIALSWLLGRL